MLHTHFITAVCCAEEKLENHCFFSVPYIVKLILNQHQISKYTESYILHCCDIQDAQVPFTDVCMYIFTF